MQVNVSKRKLEYLDKLNSLIEKKKELDFINLKIKEVESKLDLAFNNPDVFLEREIENDRIKRDIIKYFSYLPVPVYPKKILGSYE